MSTFPFADVELSRRLELTEAHGAASFIDARAKLVPESHAERIEVAGASALFDGSESPMTQTFGLGILQPTSAHELDEIETFFRDREAKVYHEVSPMADESTFRLLNQRGYRPIEFTSVMYRPVDSPTTIPSNQNPAIQARKVELGEEATWAATAAEGWSEFGDFLSLMNDVGRMDSFRDDGSLFLAELDDRPIAAAALNIVRGVVLLAGASTIPSERKQGAQGALLASRLEYAVARGCDLAMICALPGSASQRNAERNGFRIAYTRTKWELP